MSIFTRLVRRREEGTFSCAECHDGHWLRFSSPPTVRPCPKCNEDGSRADSRGRRWTNGGSLISDSNEPSSDDDSDVLTTLILAGMLLGGSDSRVEGGISSLPE